MTQQMTTKIAPAYDGRTWGLKFQGVGWPPLFVAIKPCSNPPYYINGCLRSKTTKKKPYQKEAPTPSKAPTKRQCDFRCL
jgi:hypothetical protein